MPAGVIVHHLVLDVGVKFVQKSFSVKGLANIIREGLKVERTSVLFVVMSGGINMELGTWLEAAKQKQTIE